MADLQNIHYSDLNVEERQCPAITVNNALIWTPIFVSPMKVCLETILLWWKPQFDFENKVKLSLKIFSALAICEVCLR